MDHSSSQAEKRARLRRAKILTNSEDRMNRIFGVQSSQSSQTSSSSSKTTNDIPRDLPPPSHHHQQILLMLTVPNVHHLHIILPNHSEQSSSTATIDSILNQPQHGCLPPRDESFPRKVSLISSPIHYKTLQQSQRFQQQQNSILSKIFIWPSLYLMNLKLLLFTISCIGSYYAILIINR
ncbi:hypothetical protein DERP_009982 [Dermatophagoides pteronyssinus]|uniref:Uncharacterized protein n=1 Tax=Dermatophagoides pteronyssinus TaxID=6956 RepID=A0ABQ8J240_DERPT|nr:hypothetical protein DERP_009982 [Dermatophagoides pteronyssinus]